MRKSATFALVGVAALLIALALWALLGRSAAPVAPPAPQPAVPGEPAAAAIAPPPSSPTAEPTAPAVRFSVTAQGPHGPVPGALVTLHAPSPIAEDPLFGPMAYFNEFPRCGAEAAGVTRQLARLGDVRAAVSAPIIASGTTDKQGIVELSAPAATWRMRAQAAGLVGDLTQAVAANEVVHLHLVPLHAIRGIVRDAHEQPLSGASVAAVSPSAGSVVLSSTASDGTFVIDDVPADSLIVVAWKDGYGMEQQPVSADGHIMAAMLLMTRLQGPWTPTFDLVRTHAVSGRVVRGKAPVPHARVEVKDQRCTLKVVADEAGQFAAEGVGAGAVDVDAISGASHGRTTVKVAQEDLRGVVVLLGDGAFVEGRVVDQAGRPAAGMQVNATTRTLPLHGASAETGPDGLYEAGPLEPGQYSVNFSPSHCRAAGPVQVSLVAGQRARVDFTIDAGAAIKGRVVDAQGTPVASAWIHERMGMHGFGREPPSFGHATSGDDGSFVMDGMSPGAHSFDVHADGFAEKSVDLTAPADAVAITLVKGLRCPGRVVDEAGAPIAKANVYMKLATEEIGGRSVSARADEKGEFTIGPLTAGAYGVDGFVGFASHRLTYPMTVTVTEACPPLLVHAKRGFSLSGRVTDEAGRAVGRARVAILEQHLLPRSATEPPRPHAERETLSDERGAFNFADVEEANHLIAAKDGYLHSEPVAFAESKQGIVLSLKHVGAVCGRVVDPEHAPVTLFAVDRQWVRPPDGAFCATLPPDGKLDVEILAQGFLARKLSFQEPAGSDRAIGDVVLSRGRSLSVLVVDDATGAPVSGAHVETEYSASAVESISAGAQTGPDGRARLEGLPEQEVPIRVRHDEYGTARLDARAGGEVRVALLRGGSIDGTVRSEKGAPVPDVTVVAMGYEVRHDVTGADGSFHLQGLLAGPYELRAHSLRPTGTAPGLSVAERTVQIAEGERVHVDLVAR